MSKHRGEPKINDPALLARANAFERERADAAARALRRVMRTPDGQLALDHILHDPQLCGLDADPFTGNSNTYFLLGQQKVGRNLVTLLKSLDPRAWLELQAASIRREYDDLVQREAAKCGRAPDEEQTDRCKTEEDGRNEP